MEISSIRSEIKEFELKTDVKFEMINFKLKLLVGLIVVFSVLGPKLSQIMFSFLQF